ncbi:DUF1161 domain-containing protein [Azotobacter beijerinckii]|uniref:DUF1161 domain-containing protein n=1 Tax=Azotobacter beijerinckii TaxID=170623 RepID=A0A1I4CF52_9GAMM|nr:DUF1161 domain-containing protein [Azotobacter beijerinckii]SEP79795.1 Protein of unknown function [Azotobacter beijerinckii]SFB22476.1 Protein of unknown function [Azotobacter beijerinckii]SFK79575.1 Protein of unknown function [Azotobacter beijerinckii]
MNRSCLALSLCLLSAPLLAATKSCEKLKEEIEVKVQAAGVASYTLEIVPNADVTDRNLVVGSCAGGSKKIIYQRNDGVRRSDTAAPAPAPKPAKD